MYVAHTWETQAGGLFREFNTNLGYRVRLNKSHPGFWKHCNSNYQLYAFVNFHLSI